MVDGDEVGWGVGEGGGGQGPSRLLQLILLQLFMRLFTLNYMFFFPFLANVFVPREKSKKLLGVGGLTIRSLQEETGKRFICTKLRGV